MKNFKEGGFKKGGFNNKPKFGGGKFGGDRGDKRRGGGQRGSGHDRGRHAGKPAMFSATCAGCGKTCEVPFRPTGEKPVYCSACFSKRTDESSESRGGDRRGDARSGRPDFTKLPRDQRPPRHAHLAREAQTKELDEIKQKLATIESRLNRILDLINPPTPSTKAIAAETVAEKAPAKKVAKKPAAKKATTSKTATKKTPTKKATTTKKATKKAVTKKVAKKTTKTATKKTAKK